MLRIRKWCTLLISLGGVTTISASLLTSCANKPPIDVYQIFGENKDADFDITTSIDESGSKQYYLYKNNELYQDQEGWNISNDKPSNVTISGTGMLSWTPFSAADKYSFTINATVNGNSTASQVITLTVNGSTPTPSKGILSWSGVENAFTVNNNVIEAIDKDKLTQDLIDYSGFEIDVNGIKDDVSFADTGIFNEGSPIQYIQFISPSFGQNSSNQITVGNNVFKNCQSLKEILILSDPEAIVSYQVHLHLGEYAFAGCKNLLGFKGNVPESGIPEFLIDCSDESNDLSDTAFVNCSNLDLSKDSYHFCTGCPVAIANGPTYMPGTDNTSGVFFTSIETDHLVKAGLISGNFVDDDSLWTLLNYPTSNSGVFPDNFFKGCASLRSLCLTVGDKLDNVTFKKDVFADCASLKTIYISEKQSFTFTEETIFQNAGENGTVIVKDSSDPTKAQEFINHDSWLKNHGWIAMGKGN